MKQLPSTWFSGRVVHGFANGREFGFPTANVQVTTGDITRLRGVFAAQARTIKGEFAAMLYIGTRPTLALTEVSVEIHLFDFQDDIYDSNLDFRLIAHIRDEIQFPSVAALIAQLQQDEIAVRAALATATATKN